MARKKLRSAPSAIRRRPHQATLVSSPISQPRKRSSAFLSLHSSSSARRRCLEFVKTLSKKLRTQPMGCTHYSTSPILPSTALRFSTYPRSENLRYLAISNGSVIIQVRSRRDVSCNYRGMFLFFISCRYTAHRSINPFSLAVGDWISLSNRASSLPGTKREIPVHYSRTILLPLQNGISIKPGQTHRIFRGPVDVSRRHHRPRAASESVSFDRTVFRVHCLALRAAFRKHDFRNPRANSFARSELSWSPLGTMHRDYNCEKARR